MAVLPPPASAAFNPDGFDFWVDSEMGPIKSRVFRAADGNTGRVVYALDGMRARTDLSGWEIDTEVVREVTKWNINVVIPVGGPSNFYADWNGPTTSSAWAARARPPPVRRTRARACSPVPPGGPGKTNTYKWETFLTNNLR